MRAMMTNNSSVETMNYTISPTLHLLIFKTNINCPEKVNQVNALLGKHSEVNSWSVDMEDVDKVLRIQCNGSLSEREMILLLEQENILCEDLD